MKADIPPTSLQRLRVLLLAFAASRPVTFVQRLTHTRPFIILAIFLFTIEVIFFLAGDVQDDAVDYLEGDLTHSLRRIAPFHTTEVFLDYLSAADPNPALLPICPPGVEKGIKGECQTVSEMLYNRDREFNDRSLQNLRLHFSRTPGGFVHTAGYLASQELPTAIFLVCPVVLTAWFMRKELHKPVAWWAFAFCVGIVGLALQWGAILLALFVAHTLELLGLITAGKFIVDLPTRAADLIRDWYEPASTP